MSTNNIQGWEGGLKDAFYGDFSTYDMIDAKYEDVKEFFAEEIQKAQVEVLEGVAEHADGLAAIQLNPASAFDIGFKTASERISTFIRARITNKQSEV